MHKIVLKENTKTSNIDCLKGGELSIWEMREEGDFSLYIASFILNIPGSKA